MLGKVSCGNSESCSIDFFRQYNHLFEIQEFEHFIPVVELQKDLVKIAKNNKELAIKLCSYYPKLIDNFEFEIEDVVKLVSLNGLCEIFKKYITNQETFDEAIVAMKQVDHYRFFNFFEHVSAVFIRKNEIAFLSICITYFQKIKKLTLEEVKTIDLSDVKSWIVHTNEETFDSNDAAYYMVYRYPKLFPYIVKGNHFVKTALLVYSPFRDELPSSFGATIVTIENLIKISTYYRQFNPPQQSFEEMLESIKKAAEQTKSN